jgi:hypothetical protein
MMEDAVPNGRQMDESVRHAPLAMDAATFRAIGHRLVDQLAEYLDALPRGPVTRDESPSAVRELLDLAEPLPESGMDAGPLLERTTRLLFEHSVFNAHPRFFGYITAAPAPIGIFGDFVAAALNANVGAWTLSPAATEIESQTVRWIAGLIGFPESCGGLLVSGGNMANIVCFLTARAAQAGWDVRERGVADGSGRLRVYGSRETHTWFQKAADIAGLGTASIRWIPTDARLVCLPVRSFQGTFAWCTSPMALKFLDSKGEGNTADAAEAIGLWRDPADDYRDLPPPRGPKPRSQTTVRLLTAVGALLVGFLLAELSVMLVHRNSEVSPWFPLILLAYPIWETLFSMYRRAWHLTFRHP